MSNDHYIPKFLTKDWESKSGNLRYFDFKTNQINEKRPRELFAKEDLNSKKLENFYSREVETIVAEVRNSVLKTGQYNVGKFKKFRALYLLMMLMPDRVISSHEGGKQHEEILNFNRKDLDLAVLGFEQRYRLVIGYVKSLRLFFPSTGIFPFWIDAITCYGLPIAPQHYLALVPVIIPAETFPRLDNSALITNRSVGVDPYCDRIVLHPDIYHVSQKDLTREVLRLREGNNQMVKSVNALNQLSDQMKRYIL